MRIFQGSALLGWSKLQVNPKIMMKFQIGESELKMNYL